MTKFLVMGMPSFQREHLAEEAEARVVRAARRMRITGWRRRSLMVSEGWKRLTDRGAGITRKSVMSSFGDLGEHGVQVR